MSSIFVYDGEKKKKRCLKARILKWTYSVSTGELSHAQVACQDFKNHWVMTSAFTPGLRTDPVPVWGCFFFFLSSTPSFP